MTFSEAIQDVLTKGIDAAKTIKLAQLQVNDPTYNTVGPNGVGSRVGQGAYGVSATLSTIPPMVWIGGAALLALLVVPRLIGKG